MKKILWLLLCTLPYLGFSQGVVVPNGAVYQINYQRGGLGADSVMAIPVADTTGAGTTWANYRKIGRIMVNDSDSTLYYHDGVKWKVVGGVDTNSFIQGGNSFGEKAVLGSLDDSLVVISNNGIRIQAGGGIKTEATNRVISSVRRSGLGTDVGHIDSFVVTSQTSGAVFFRVKEVNSRIDPWFYPNGVGVTGITVNVKVPDTGATQAVGFNAFSSGARNTVGFLHNLGFGTGSNNVGVKSFQTTANPGSERYMLYSNTSIKSFLRGNLIVGEDVDDGYKLQVNGDMALKNGQEGPGKILTSSADGKINIVDPGSIVPSGAYIQGGNAFGETAVMGTTDNHPLEIKANDNVALRINPDGSVQYADGTQMVYKPGTEGPGKILTSSADGTVNIVDPGSILPEGAYIQGGNAFGETAILGTTDNEALEIKANDNVALRINPDATVQYTDGTQGDGKILMSSADGTLSAQSQDSVLKGVWRSGVINDMGNHATLRASADTITIRGVGGSPLMQSVGSQMAFNDVVRNSVDGMRFFGSAPSTGNAGLPIFFEGRFPVGATGNRVGITFRALGAPPATPTSISVLAIGRSATAMPTWVGITDENWGGTSATNNYFMRMTTFQPSSTNWFLYTQNPVKSQLPGNLLLNKVVDNGYKLQVGEGGIHVESPDEPEKQLVLTTPFTPGNTADAAGEVGAITWDNDYLYIKTTAGWKRAALSNF